MTSSSFVGCSTGRSAGFVPLRVFWIVDRSPIVHIGKAGAVKHQAAGAHELALAIHGGQPTLGRQLHDPPSMVDEHNVRQHHESSGTFAGHCREGLVELVGVLNLQQLELERQCPGCTLTLFQKRLRVWRGRIREDGHARYSWHGVLERLEPLHAQHFAKRRHSREISPWPREARDEPASTGFSVVTITKGIVLVALFAARAPWFEPTRMIRRCNPE